MSPAIQLTAIDKRFGPVHANRDVNLSVARGTIHGIVGRERRGQVDVDVDSVRLL